MIIEPLMTRFLRHLNQQYLTFKQYDSIDVPAGRPGQQYLLYVHIPFCEQLCPYCSFNRYAFNEKTARRYFAALRQEIRWYKDKNYHFNGVYVGGGTPTVLVDELVETLTEIRSLFPVREISVETNPNHLTDDIVSTLKTAGVNRLSVGVQSFDDGLLQSMERYHKYGSGAEIEARLKEYTGTFDTLNVDMIFNFPTQTEQIMERDLEVINRIPADQVTFYPLMASTSNEKAIRKTLGKVDYAQEKRFYQLILRRLSAHYTPGSAWCFSRKKSMIDEYIVDYDEYVGVGSGSFSYVSGTILSNTFSVSEYCSALEKGALPVTAKKEFTLLEQMRYDLLMKLFGTRLDRAAVRRKYGSLFEQLLWKEITLFRLLGGLRSDNDLMVLTPKGMYYWVIMMREFFIGVNNFRDMCRSAIADEGKQ
ncbi:MAG: coproporphyrinogen III oxidase family protein [Deltaproteobacteria bacterium]|nr:coproporphyrinogen III oxidase family protein [Candidatus Anaeroferrophillus wilburensis]MBN2890100.1 coproporphyrinogen III oxidase family protein [Deltaproteobacteria bacterium]